MVEERGHLGDGELIGSRKVTQVHRTGKTFAAFPTQHSGRVHRHRTADLAHRETGPDADRAKIERNLLRLERHGRRDAVWRASSVTRDQSRSAMNSRSDA